MKTYENLRGKRADVGGVKSEPIKFPLLFPLGSLLFPSPPFYFLLATSQPRFIRFCRASSLADVRRRIYMFPYRASREKKKSGDAREIPRAPQLNSRFAGAKLELDRLLRIDVVDRFLAARLHLNWTARKRH